MSSLAAVRQFSEHWCSVERWMAIGSAFLLYWMVGIISLEVILRRLFHISIPCVIEISEFLMVILVYLSIAYAQAVKANIRMDFVINRLSPKARAILELIGLSIATCLFVLITWQTFLNFWGDFVIGEVTYGRPALLTWPHKLFMPLGCTFLVFRFILDIVVTVSELMKGDKNTALP